MGLKFEFLLVAMIIFTSVLTMSTTLKRQHTSPLGEKKELVFTQTAFTEVTTEGSEGVAYGSYGERKEGVLTIRDLKYYDADINLLTADRGRYDASKVHLDGNVSLYRRDGFSYRTEHAVYDRNISVFYATAPFVAEGKSYFLQGDKMAYLLRKKELYASKVRAVVNMEGR